jgi:hypothetical protein
LHGDNALFLDKTYSKAKKQKYSKYILDLTDRAYDLFVSSKVEERRQLMKLVLSNLRIEDKKVLYNAQKPFNMILKTTDRKQWRG